MSNNNTTYDGTIPSHAEAFVSMDPARTAVQQAASNSVQRPAPAAAKPSTSSPSTQTQQATNQQFNNDGSVRR
ncbi:uncharacterized protein AB675_226 [Cyphellophora attinorum]|uniref:Uncharacterized protein n=1 Tax=Cyphellophora attinorum TaxID=1664694 RepID=A0A0N1H5L5_9EURO|nr:uncharacterized protein AB675_226 [Phialophora attinorum]KPI37724.1 hypothetical protein AB675_226 [Phialophora attinorum]